MASLVLRRIDRKLRNHAVNCVCTSSRPLEVVCKKNGDEKQGNTNTMGSIVSTVSHDENIDCDDCNISWGAKADLTESINE